MTRINTVPVEELTRQHLIAEYREIMRLPSSLERSITSKKGLKDSDIPSEFKLGKGHVKFFYNKMKFLQKRFEELTREMVKRGYKVNYIDSSIFIPKDKIFYKDWEPTETAIRESRARIQARLSSSVDKKARK